MVTRHANHKLTPEDESWAMRLVENGMALKDVADEFYVGYGVIYRAAIKYKLIAPRKKELTPRRMSKIDMMRQLCIEIERNATDNNLTVRQACESTGLLNYHQYTYWRVVGYLEV